MPRGDDTITYGRTEGGARKVTARPEERDTPSFTFHPDGYVGVTFPGQEKPTVFENQEEVFKTVLAPMNPDRWTSKPGTAKDVVTSAKNVREAEFKDKKLQADVHDKAHESAMKQFYVDGYYQPSLYKEKEYWDDYNSYVQRATGTVPKKRPQGAEGKGGRTGPPRQYKGDDAPKGFPGARRGPRGGWYMQKKGKWYPVLDGKEESPAASPDKERSPGRSPMDEDRQTAGSDMDIQASGIPDLTEAQTKRAEGVGFRPRRKNKKKGQVYRGTAPPPDYPDAQYDRDDGIWRYYDSKKQKWRKVMI
jgi:hypothetical protein